MILNEFPGIPVKIQKIGGIHGIPMGLTGHLFPMSSMEWGGVGGYFLKQ